MNNDEQQKKKRKSIKQNTQNINSLKKLNTLQSKKQQQKQVISKPKSLKLLKKNTQQQIKKVDIYIGQQLNGIPHGTGTMQYVNGDYYKGQWVNGQKQGKGEHYYFQLRTVYKGQWKHNVKNGNGYQTQSTGSYYQGQFKDGNRHGKGVYFDKQKNQKYQQIYISGSLKQRILIFSPSNNVQQQFPTLKLDKERFNTDDLTGFQQRNPQIKQLDLQFLLKYYGLKRVINLDFIDIPINQWTIKHVHLFLQQINLSIYKPIFYQNKLKGKDLATLDQNQMKSDLGMKLGDRKILIAYISYLNNVNNKSKKQGKRKRRGSITVRKKKQSLLQSITKSIQHQIIQQDQQWNQQISDQQQTTKRQSKQSRFKHKNRYQTQQLKDKWDKFNSIGQNQFSQFQSITHPASQSMNDNQSSDKTNRGSNQDLENDINQFCFNNPSNLSRKKSADNDLTPGRNSQGRKQNNKQYKQKSISSSSTDQNNQIIKMKPSKHLIKQNSSQIRQLYEFLRNNRAMDFIIKQKDIQIIQQIGQGGYGKVFLGKYMQYPVAIKDYMKAGRSHKSRQQFMKQVHVLSDLKHPNIVLYMGLCITVNKYQLVTQFMQNGSLYDQLHIKKTKFNNDQQLQIIDDIVQGMVYLHNMKDMLHRDLKSSNVLIAQDYKVKLCDFGLSGHKNKNKTKKNRIGTYQWMAPQVIRNQQLDFYSDVYSFGVILWQILTQQVPYFGMSQTQIIGNVGFDNYHTLPKPPQGCDIFIHQLMIKCLNRQGSQRPTFIQIQQMIQQQRKNRPVITDVSDLWSNL